MDSFGTVLIVVALVGIVIACVSYIGSGAIYQGLGRTGMTTLDEPDMRPSPAPGSAAADAEAQAEIRQMLEAKSDRREARGQAPLDIDAEMADLRGSNATMQDEGLREEVRQLVVARNERRMRRGEDPLDVESEVDRQLRDLTA